MKVGTDSVLLGAWANLTNACTVLDVGTGTGLLSLMCAQRTKKSRITGIEIDENAYSEAVYNVDKSPWHDRICLKRCSLQKFKSKTIEKYDYIICNPPFFSNSLKSPSAGRSIARHDDALTLETLLHYSVSLLKPQGIAGLIIPVVRYDDFLSQLMNNKLHVTRKTSVRSKQGGKVIRILVECSREKQECIETNLAIRSDTDNQYTREYIEFTKDFYLYF